MKALLMHRDRDFDLAQDLPDHAPQLTQDLELETLLEAMAEGDKVLYDVAQRALFAGLHTDVETIVYRQAILQDALRNPAVVRALYDLTVEAIETRRHRWLGIFGNNPGAILHGSIDLMQMFTGILKRLRDLARKNAHRFESEGFRTLFAMLQDELDDAHLARAQAHLGELRFRSGVRVSAGLGTGNEGRDYVLRQPAAKGWVQRLVGRRGAAYSFRIHPRDEAGAMALAALRDRGVHLAANALAQSADHILGFFQVLRTEPAFYLGCLNLERQLAAKGVSVCTPVATPVEQGDFRCAGLVDVCLALHLKGGVVGNAVNADGKRLVVITGANRGGKSSFLRSVGLAQLMMQSGMFVGARSFAGHLCTGLFTHYRREEDASMQSGKLDEELARMSWIADRLAPGAILLLNESFAATNEREGSEIARQITSALLEKGVRLFFVTFLLEFARGFLERQPRAALFLRAERLDDGTRTFRLVEAEPLDTGYGEDLYRHIFGAGMEPTGAP